MRIYKPKAKQHSRESILEMAIKSSISYRIGLMANADEKRVLIATHNPHHYIFGEYRRAWKPYLTYQENMEVQYIGEQVL